MTNAEKFEKIQDYLMNTFGVYVTDTSPNYNDLMHSFFGDGYGTVSLVYTPSKSLTADTDEPLIPEILHPCIAKLASALILFTSDRQEDHFRGRTFLELYREDLNAYSGEQLTNTNEATYRLPYFP